MSSIERLNDKEWVREQYTKKRRSAQDIAAELGCHVKQVQRAMARHKIRPRSRGDASKAAYAAGRRKPAKGRKMSVEARDNIAKGMRAWWANRPQADVDKHAAFAARVWQVSGWRKRAGMRKKGGRVARARVPGRSKLCQFLVAELSARGFPAEYGDQPVDIKVGLNDDEVVLVLMDGYFRQRKPPEKRAARLAAVQALPHKATIRVNYSGSQFTRRWAARILAGLLAALASDLPEFIELTYNKENKNGEEAGD